MAKLKFVGIIKEADSAKYQKYSTNKKLTTICSDKDNIQLKAMPICMVLVILCNILLFAKIFSGLIAINPLFLIVGFLIGVLFLIVHEILHGIVYPSKTTVSIGFIPPVTFVALGSYPMSKKRFALMCLLPLILGIIPMILFLVFNNSALCCLLFGIMCVGIISPYPDIYNVYQVARKVPKGKKVLFFKDLLAYIN